MPKWRNQNAVKHGLYARLDVVTVEPDGFLHIRVIGGKPVGIRIRPEGFDIKPDGIYLRQDVSDELKRIGVLGSQKTGQQAPKPETASKC